MTAPDDLRTTMLKLTPQRYQEIREAYYKAIEGLRTLMEATEMADAELVESPTPLLDEHMFAVTGAGGDEAQQTWAGCLILVRRGNARSTVSLVTTSKPHSHMRWRLIALSMLRVRHTVRRTRWQSGHFRPSSASCSGFGLRGLRSRVRRCGFFRLRPILAPSRYYELL